MLKADEINALRDAATELTQPIIKYLLRDLAERVAKAGELTSTTQYEFWKLQQLGMSQREIKEQLQKLLKVSKAELGELLTQSAEAGYRFDLSRLPTTDRIPFEQNGVVQNIVSAAVKLAQDDLTNITQTLGMIDPYGRALPLQQAYRSCMDYAFMQASTGAVDYNTAIRQATKRLAEKGVQYIDYESGVHTSLEAAVRRSVMGGMGLMQEQISQRTHDDFECDGWEISAHYASAPDHEPIQGKQYPDAAYQDLNNSLVRRIGTLNCGHAAYPIHYGVTHPQYSAAELEEMRQANAKGITYNGKHYTSYEATQRQRNLEASIRRQRRKILVDEATGDAEQLQPDQIKLQLLNQEYKRFSKAAGLRMQDERMEVVGYNWRHEKAVEKAAQSHYRDWSKSIGADSSIKTLAEYYDVRYNDSPRYKLLKRYAHDVESGWISPLLQFDNYEALYNRIQTEIVGNTAGNGTVITGQAQHFMQRVTGTMVDPQKLRDNLQIIRRSGVEIENIKDALFNPLQIYPVRVTSNGEKSVKLRGSSCAVTINPDTGILIQTNPLKPKKEGKPQ